MDRLKKPPECLPKHLGIIMDGNGRWAKKRGLPREMGHKAGAKAFTKIVRHCKDIGIEYLTVYAFSTENWKRPAGEVDALMNLLAEYLKDAEQYMNENARLVVIGDLKPLRQDLRSRICEAMEQSKNNTAITVNIALNYGGRDELTAAVQQIAADCVAGRLSPGGISQKTISEHLYTAGQPDPDLIIRPSGECRLSNFLLWQSAYAELLFMDVLWPDFTPEHLNFALQQYAQRDRRFGGI